MARRLLLLNSSCVQEPWFVYVLRCGDGTLYTGVAKEDPERRLEEHRAGKGARYTRGRLPIDLVACSPPLTRSEALRLEIQTKRLPKTKKLSFVRG
jgi:predicted GIY-YIG superfamily endonuclease